MAYTCPYCRQSSDDGSTTCPHCGAATDVRMRVSDSGWEKQPPIRDMARIQFGTSKCQIEGTLVPVADFDLRDEGIYFSHHVLLWTEPSVQISAMPMSGGWNRSMAGLPLVMMQAAGPGHLALSDDHPGEIIAVPLAAGQSIVVREHRFLAASSPVSYGWRQAPLWFTTQPLRSNESETHWPMSVYVDTFSATDRPGLLLIHSPGNTYIRDLQPGESVYVQPTALLYWDTTVQMQFHFELPYAMDDWETKNPGLARYRINWAHVTGPGRVAVQSVFERPEGMGGRVVRSSGSTTHSW